MKTRKQQISEMIEGLEEDLIKQQVVKDYREYVFTSDERFKGNLEAEKELKASEMSIDRTEKMLKWLNDELLRTE
jgi:hypothetical protein